MFELLEKYLMGPMGKVSTWRPVLCVRLWLLGWQVSH